MSDNSKREAVERVRAENVRRYDTPQGYGFLRMLDLTFEERWIYLVELLQNAIDARANRVAIRVEDSGLVFEHDGKEELTLDSVQAMSEVFRSTKGAATVGFMGIGFKSLFRRFRHVGVTGFGWSYTYRTALTLGERFQDRQLDLLGCVLPTWDDALSPPGVGYTTRFYLSELLDPVHDLTTDIATVVPDGDATVLALLGYHGLTSLQLGNTVWSLQVTPEGDHPLVTASAGSEQHNWRLFIQRYVPSDEAVARFLERRRLRPSAEERDHIYSLAQRPREVVGLLPLDHNGAPRPPDTGRIYATMPTSATWPFRMHLHADWLVNISRTGLPELDDNAWQENIIAQVPGVIAGYLQWLTASYGEPEALRAGFSILRVPTADGPTTLEKHMSSDEWRARLADAIRPLQLLPTYEAGDLHFCASVDAAFVPAPFRPFSDNPSRRPDLLFGRSVLATHLLGEATLQLLIWAGLVEELTATHLREHWGKSIGDWWSALGNDTGTNHDTLFELWAAIAILTQRVEEWNQLPCIPTMADQWISPTSANYLADPAPSANDPLEASLFGYLESHLPSKETAPALAIINALRVPDAKDRPRPERRIAREWFERTAIRTTLSEVTASAVDWALAQSDTPTDFFLRLAHWARHRNRGDLVTHLVAIRATDSAVVLAREAVLAEPYAEHSTVRRRMWPDHPVVSGEYVTHDPYLATGDNWRAFLEARGTVGPIRIVATELRASRWEKEKVADFGGTSVAGVPATSSNAGYKLTDRVFDPPLELGQLPHLAEWLEGEYTKLTGQGERTLWWSYHSPGSQSLPRRASWVQALQDKPWVPIREGGFAMPANVLSGPDPAREDSPTSDLSSLLIAHLEREGVVFGTNIPTVSQVRRIRRTGDTLEPEALAAEIVGALDAVAGDDEQLTHLREALAGISLPRADGRRVGTKRLVKRVGPGFRSSLGGWVASLDELAEPLRAIFNDPRLPLDIPPTTTGTQACAFLTDVWQRARLAQPGLAEEVRRLLPASYSYVTEDMDDDPSLASLWDSARRSAMVFGMGRAARQWAPIEGEVVPLFDDLHDPLLRPFLQDNEIIVTSGHLGDSALDQANVAEALGLKKVSAVLQPSWTNGIERAEPAWVSRFEVLQALLRGASEDGQEFEPLTLKPITSIRAIIRGVTRELSARLRGQELLVVNEPPDFADEATAIVLEYYGLEDETKRTTFATVLVGALSDDVRFRNAASKFVRAFAPQLAEGFLAHEQDLSGHPTVTETPQPVFTNSVADDQPDVGSGDQLSEHHRARIVARAEDIGAAVASGPNQELGNNTELEQPGRGFSGVRQITPEQQRRGQIGEAEFMRRVSAPGGWGGMTLIADRTRAGCGYDFLCSSADGELKVELKTFAAGGHVVITPREWTEARASRGTYRIIGLLAEGQAPEHWNAYVLDDPFPVLQAEGEWQLAANLEITPGQLFRLSP